MRNRINTLVILVILSIVAMAGCTGIKAPADLMDKPSTEISQERLREAVDKLIPAEAKLIIPINIDNMNAINRVDLDADGIEEALAFYKKGDYELGLVIVTKIQEEWKKAATIEGLGQEVDYIGFEDLNGDKKSEIIVGWSGGSGLDSNLEVYSFTQDKCIKLMEQKYTATAAGDLDGDNKAELVILKLDKRDPMQQSAQAFLYKYTDNKLECIDTIEMDGYINGYSQVIIGNAAAGRKAVFIDVGVGAHSAYTDMLLVEDGHLKRAFENSYEQTFKPRSYLCEDIDNDNIIEIALCKVVPGYEDKSMVETLWFNTWYKWSETGNLKQVEETYWSYVGRYILHIPQKWQDKITIEETEIEKVIMTEFLYICPSGKQKASLLKIYTFELKEWQQRKAAFSTANPDYVMLGKYKNKVNLGVIDTASVILSESDLQQYESMQLDATELKQIFTPDNYKF